MTDQNAALFLSAKIIERCSTPEQIVRRFDDRALRFSKGDMITVATARSLPTSGTRSELAWRIARAAVGGAS